MRPPAAWLAALILLAPLASSQGTVLSLAEASAQQQVGPGEVARLFAAIFNSASTPVDGILTIVFSDAPSSTVLVPFTIPPATIQRVWNNRSFSTPGTHSATFGIQGQSVTKVAYIDVAARWEFLQVEFDPYVYQASRGRGSFAVRNAGSVPDMARVTTSVGGAPQEEISIALGAGESSPVFEVNWTPLPARSPPQEFVMLSFILRASGNVVLVSNGTLVEVRPGPRIDAVATPTQLAGGTPANLSVNVTRAEGESTSGTLVRACGLPPGAAKLPTSISSDTRGCIASGTAGTDGIAIIPVTPAQTSSGSVLGLYVDGWLVTNVRVLPEGSLRVVGAEPRESAELTILVGGKGEPLAGAIVTARHASTGLAQSATTGAHGLAHLTLARSGDHDVTATHPDFAPRPLRLTAFRAIWKVEATPLTIQTGPQAIDIEALDLNAAPASFAPVTVCGEPLAPANASTGCAPPTITDASGRARVAIEPRTTGALAILVGHVGVNATVVRAAHTLLVLTLDVRAGERFEVLAIEATGRAAPGITVVLEPENGSDPFAVLTDAEGIAGFFLPRGAYDAVARLDDATTTASPIRLVVLPPRGALLVSDILAPAEITGPFEVLATVANTAGETIPTRADLLVDGDVVRSLDLVLEPGESRAITLDAAAPAVGSHEIEIRLEGADRAAAVTVVVPTLAALPSAHTPTPANGPSKQEPAPADEAPVPSPWLLLTVVATALAASRRKRG